MTAINLKGLRGKVPRIAARMLKPNYATEALNCKFQGGRLEPYKGPALVHTSSLKALKTLFRYRRAGLDYWMVWNNVVDAVRSPAAQDPYDRVYYTGDGEPRVATFMGALAGVGPYPTEFNVLGVYFSPSTYAGFTVGSVTGGAAPVVTRSYIYTFVTQHGEESPPCEKPAIFNGNVTGTWNLAGMELPPQNNGVVTGATSLAGGIVRLTVDTSRGLARYEQIEVLGVNGMTDVNRLLTIHDIPDSTHIDVALQTSQVFAASPDGLWKRRAPHNLTNMKRRIYRSVGTNRDFKFVTEIPATQQTYADAVLDANLGAACPTLFSWGPPKNLHSVRVLANGSLGGIAGNEVCFSEPGKPYSWPLDNRYAFAGAGIATASVGNSLIVLTDSYPLVVTATDPAQASVAKLPVYAPCVSKRGAVDAGDGAIYPSHDGLWFVGPSGAKLLTEDIYRMEQWQDILPSTFIAAIQNGRYYAVHQRKGVNERSYMLVYDRLDPDCVVEIDDFFDTLYFNPYDGKLYVVRDDKVYEWDADDNNRYTMFWQSAEFQMAKPVNFIAAQVHGEYEDLAPPDLLGEDYNRAVLQDANNVMGAFGDESGLYAWGGTNLLDVAQVTTNRVQFNLLRDGHMAYTKDLASSDPFRCPGGKRAEIYQVQIRASLPIESTTVAQSMSELGRTSE